jgi:hypothetical protein
VRSLNKPMLRVRKKVSGMAVAFKPRVTHRYSMKAENCLADTASMKRAREKFEATLKAVSSTTIHMAIYSQAWFRPESFSKRRIDGQIGILCLLAPDIIPPHFHSQQEYTLTCQGRQAPSCVRGKRTSLRTGKRAGVEHRGDGSDGGRTHR